MYILYGHAHYLTLVNVYYNNQFTPNPKSISSQSIELTKNSSIIRKWYISMMDFNEAFSFSD